MAAHSTKVDWNLLTDEEEKREKKPRARTEVTTYIREKDGGAPGQMVRETVKLEKRVYPISRAAIERKNMRKFGDVKEVPLGTHLKGDFIQQEDLNIETMQCADKGEIDIVNKLSKINTESIKMRKDKERMELLQNVGSNANNTGAGAVAAAAAAAAAQAANDFIEVGDKSKKPKTIEQITFSHDSEEYTIEISNILSFFNAKNEDQILEEERLFKLLLEEFTGRNTTINRYHVRFPRNRKTRDMMGKAFVTFFDKITAENLLDDIDGEEYGNSILSADWARQRAPIRR